MSLSSLACRQCRPLAYFRTSAVVARRPTPMMAARRLQSTKPEEGPPPTMQNVALASVLTGFVVAVFTYSMNAVGRSGEENDPLALLKEEAQEARQMKQANEHNRKLSKEEIAALESGMSGVYDESTKLEVAVAAPADVAQIEEEANLKVFKQKQGGDEKKKPRWRFGF